jgi:bacterioferritin-associated ferredoxin
MTTPPNDQDDEILCPCTGTRRSLIRELHAQGRDMEGISRYTGILTGCGGCEWEIGEYLQTLPVPPEKPAS